MYIQIQHVPLLKIQRDLHDMPRTMERFQEYLQMILTESQDEVLLPPMISMNPMGREHVAEKLGEWLALDGESIAIQAVNEAMSSLTDENTETELFLESLVSWLKKSNLLKLQHGLVVIDDVQGGWTNRYTTEAALLFEDSYAVKQHWITTPLWASEAVSQRHLRQGVLQSIYRSLHILQNGLPRTLRQMMAQEGAAARFAGMEPLLDDDDLAYSREVIEPYLDDTDYPRTFAAMYGDAAAHLLGYEPLGLSERAGFAIALSMAQ